MRESLRSNSEREHQIAVFDCLRLNEAQYPQLKWVFASMNGLYSKSARMAADRKRQGQRAGISDICIPFLSTPMSAGSPHYVGAYIELKAGANKATPEQSEFLELVRGQGYAGIVARGCEECLDFVEYYMQIKLRGRK